MDLQPIVLAHEPDFRIGDVEVRPAARELVTATGRTMLEPRVMQMLIALHRAGGAVVTKDELIRLCWNNRIVGEDAISRVASRLRVAAAQHARNCFRVETITKVGYRLVESEVAANDDPEPLATRDAATSVRPAQRSRRALLIGVGAAFLTGGSVLGFDLVRRERLDGEAKALADEARRAFLLGNPDEDASAVGMMRRAVALKPDNAEVWGLLALGYMRMLANATGEDRTEARERGQAAARRALELDPDQPDAKAALLSIMPLYRNWLAFEQASTGSYQRHSSNLDLCILHATLLSQVGRIAEILPPSVSAVKRAPVHPAVQTWNALVLLELGRIDEGEAQLERCFSLWPRRPDVFLSRFNHLLYNRRADEALQMVRNRSRLPSLLSSREIDLAEMRAATVASRDLGQIEGALDRLEAAARESSWFAEDAITFAANQGDIDRAFRILDALYFDRGFTVRDGSPSLSGRRERNTYFLFWRVTQTLRRDPRFAGLTSALGLEDYWRKSGSRGRVAT